MTMSPGPGAPSPGELAAPPGSMRARLSVPRGWRDLRIPIAIALASRAFSVAVVAGYRFIHGQPYPINEFDSAWYLGIVRTGYHAQEASPGAGHDLAFFPGWPLVIKAATLGILDPAFVGLLLANVISFLAILFVWKVLEVRFGRSTATGGTMLLAFAPPAFVFALPYSEGLFLFAVALAFWAGTSRWRAVPTAAAMLTRINGGPLVAGTAVAAVLRRGAERVNLALAVATGVVAFACWYVFVALVTGDPLGFVHSGPAGWVPNSGIREFVQLVTHPQHNGTMLLRLAFVGLIAIGALLVAFRDAELGTYALATVALVVLPGATVKSDPRYVMMAFPAFAALSERLGRKGTIALAVAFALLQVVLIRDAFPAGSHGRIPP